VLGECTNGNFFKLDILISSDTGRIFNNLNGRLLLHSLAPDITAYCFFFNADVHPSKQVINCIHTKIVQKYIFFSGIFERKEIT
jgi:hypothetical protein